MLKPIHWMGSSKDDLSGFPAEVKADMGQALFLAQQGEKSPSAKPLKSFAGAGVLEVIDDFDGNTYRAVYTVKFSSRVYVLHAFQKKSKSGIRTPKVEIDRIILRLKAAQEDFRSWQKQKR